MGDFQNPVTYDVTGVAFNYNMCMAFVQPDVGKFHSTAIVE